MESIAIPIRDVTKSMVINVRVTGARVWSFRFSVAKALFRVGAWVAGMGIQIETK